MENSEQGDRTIGHPVEGKKRLSKREVLAGSTVKGRWRSSPLTVTGLGFFLKGPLSSGKRYGPFPAFRGGVLTASAVLVDRP